MAGVEDAAAMINSALDAIENQDQTSAAEQRGRASAMLEALDTSDPIYDTAVGASVASAIVSGRNAAEMMRLRLLRGPAVSMDAVILLVRRMNELVAVTREEVARSGSDCSDS